MLQLAVAASAFAQAPAAELWSGRAQCQLTVQSAGYTHQETQTWEISGGAPTQSGAMAVYPATWSVTGQGSTERAAGAQTLSGQWSTNVAPVATTLAVFVRASDRRLIVKSTHAQLRADNATTGVRQAAAAGTSPSKGALSLASFEWAFPAIEEAETSTTVAGTGTIAVASNAVPMQNAGTNLPANCNWQFHKGAQSPTTANPASSSFASTGTTAASSGPSIRAVNAQNGAGGIGTIDLTAGQGCSALTASAASMQGLGTIPPGGSSTYTQRLASVSDSKLVRFDLTPGADASITLEGVPPGTDFDLNVYRSDQSSMGCSTTRGTGAETFTTQLGGSQTSNTVYVQISAHAWDASATQYRLTVRAQTASTAGSETTKLRSPLPAAVQQGLANSNPGAGCPLMGAGAAGAQTLGTLAPGVFMTYTGNLTSTSDYKILQFTLRPGDDADVTLEGVPPGSDFDLYVYRSDRMPIACSMTRGTGAETYTTQLASSQTTNTLYVQVSAYALSGSTPGYRVKVSTPPASTAASQTQTTSLRRSPGTLAQGVLNANAPPACPTLGANAAATPQILGTLSPGLSSTFTGNLAATGDTKVLQFTLTPGADASVTLSGVPPGSDFDLSVYRADRTAIGCPLTRGTGAETVTTQFGSGQTSNTVYVQVSAFSLSANAPNYQVAVQASRASQP